MSWEKKILLRSSNDVILAVEEAVVLESPVLVDFIKENNVSKSSVIVIHDVNEEILEGVMDYCRRQAKARDIGDPKVLHAELLDADPVTLFHLIHASHKLKIKSLMDLACKEFGELFGMEIKKRIEGSRIEGSSSAHSLKGVIAETQSTEETCLEVQSELSC